MGHRPKWRAILRNNGHANVLSPLFLARRGKVTDWPRCQAIAKSTGKPCKDVAIRGTDRCYRHKDRSTMKKAEEAEAERYGRPIIVLRNPRKQALVELGARTPWPEGLPKRPDLLALGPLARGRLFEAWENRLTAPDVYRHELRVRAPRTVARP
jgi:hypothetical protein